jgi:hypothetical protein
LFADHVEKVRALEGLRAEHDAVKLKREVGLLRQSAEQSATTWDGERQEYFGVGVGGSDYDDARSIRYCLN